jgi:hypothetical protein
LQARGQRCPLDTLTAATMAFTCVAMHHQYIQHGCHAALLLQLGLHQPQGLLPRRQRCRSACCTSSLPLMHQGGCTEGGLKPMKLGHAITGMRRKQAAT